MTRTRIVLLSSIVFALLLVILGLIQLSTPRGKPSPLVSIPTQDARHQRSNLRASADYLVWQQNSMDATDQRFINGSFDILGFGLKAGRPITVAYKPCNQFIWGISGPLVVWQSDKEPCKSGEQETIVTNLDTGATSEITSAGRIFYPAIDGKSVVWVELSVTGTRLVLKELDTNQVTEIKSLPMSLPPDEQPDGTLYMPKISSQYVVWTELGLSDPNTGSMPIYLQVYDRKSGTTKTQAEFQIPEFPNYEIEGHLLVWYDTGRQILHVTDLSTGADKTLEIRDIAAYISLHDNVALLTTFPGSTLDFDIYGLKLDSLETIPLIQAEGDNNSPVVVDDWLIWIKDGHLASKRLPGSMSGSPSP